LGGIGAVAGAGRRGAVRAGTGAAPGCRSAPGKQTARARRAVCRGEGVAVVWGESPYLVQLVDHELRLQLDRVGSIEPLLVLEQLQLQLDRLQLDRLQLERLHEERLQEDRV
jgi:hypothetical protein